MPPDSSDTDDMAREVEQLSDQIDALEEDMSEQVRAIADVQSEVNSHLDALATRIRHIEEDAVGVESVRALHEEILHTEEGLVDVRQRIESALEDDQSSQE